MLVIFLKEREDAILLKAGGATYAFAQLKKTDLTKPSKEAMKYITYLLEAQHYERQEDLFIVDLGLKWGDFDLWLKAANKCAFGYDPTSPGWDKVVDAWDKFGFEALCPSYVYPLLTDGRKRNS